MALYIFKRLVMIVPFGLLAVLLVFIVFESSWSPNLLQEQGNRQLHNTDSKKLEGIRCQQRKELHLDWPVFYFSITSKAIPSNVGSICSEFERNLIEYLCFHNGNTEGALQFVSVINAKLNELFNPDLDQIFTSHSISEIEHLVSKNSELMQVWSEYINNDQSYTIFIPRLEFNLTQNRFHNWVSHVIQFDFGKSTLDNQLIAYKINKALSNTLIFTLPAVVIIFILSIFIGMYTSLNRSATNTIITNILYFIDAIPLFWLSIIMILVAGFLGVGYSTMDFGMDSIWGKMARYGLPMFTLILASIPYVSKQIQQSILETENQPYITSAIAKGLSKKVIFIRHILPNASLPIVTLFFNYLAYAFGGAFVVELVFSINGIGKLMADSVLGNDLPVISAVILYLIFIKMILTLLSDMVNYWLNPSIKF